MISYLDSRRIKYKQLDVSHWLTTSKQNNDPWDHEHPRRALSQDWRMNIIQFIILYHEYPRRALSQDWRINIL